MVADDHLAGVRLADGGEVARAAVFVSPRFHLNIGALAALAPQTVDSDMGAYLDADDEGRTSVPGLWAVGTAMSTKSEASSPFDAADDVSPKS